MDLIKNYDSYISSLIEEGLTDGTQNECNRAFLNIGTITFADGSSVTAKEIVRVVDDALLHLSGEFRRTFKFASKINIIYLAHSNKIKTMAVDECLNLYMNAEFVYKNLKMDKILVGAVIMHEVFHVLFNHIVRGKNWLASKGKAVTPATWRDNNLAADVEVNQTLVRLRIISEDSLINDIHGMYLKNKNKRGDDVDVVPMETILSNDEYMNKLRGIVPPEVDPQKSNGQGGQQEIETSEEWDKGYKDAWNKIAGLIKKYGYKDAWNKLIEAGLVNAAGEFNESMPTDDIMGLEFIYVKSFGEYINESSKSTESDYEEGFKKGLEKILGKLYDAVNPQTAEGDGSGNEGGAPQPKYKSKLRKEDLEEVDLPNGSESGGESGEGEDGLPENCKSQSGSKNKDKDKKEGGGDSEGSGENGKDNESGNSSGSGNSGNNADEGDMDKLKRDLMGKSNSGIKPKDISSEEYSGIGGTGSFIDSKDNMDKILKESGYSDEDIEKINEIREKNKTRNNPHSIEKAKQEMRNKLNKDSFLAKTLKKITTESSKYENVWKDVMEKFLANKTRRAGNKINDVSINWKRKSRIALGNIGPQYLKVDQDPQDVNVYVDVSGSMNVELLEVICMSLVVFSQEYEYSGINVCPWASYSNGIHKVDEFTDRSEDEITDEILKIISKSTRECGGGTSAHAAISAMVDVVVNSLNDDSKENKDDVHVVITDGEIDRFDNIEQLMESSIKRATNRADAASTAPENTFWMIYDAPEYLQNQWRSAIKKGKIIFINSEAVINNK